LLVLCMLAPMSTEVKAAKSSATLTGSTTVRAGDTLVLTFKVNGTGIYGMSGTISYDSNVLTLSSTKQTISDKWAVEFNGNEMIAYDNNLTSPINSNTSVFTLTFKVKTGVATGTKVAVSINNFATSDGSSDTAVGNINYSTTIAAPKSTENALSSLTVSNATISPAFDAATTSYTANVGFEVSKLDIKAVAKDSKATVAVNNPTLKAGGTTDVKITVTAESGAQKVYTIKVTREQDPNYVPSSNNNLSSISVAGFLLSPVFDAAKTEYVVWLPYETESITVSAVAADRLASYEITGGTELEAGKDNVVKVVCTAENGETKTYTIIAKRAAAHGDGGQGEEPTTPEVTTEPTTDNVTDEPEDVTTTENKNQSNGDSEDKDDDDPNGGSNNKIMLIVIVVLIIIVVVETAAIAMLIMKKEKEADAE